MSLRQELAAILMDHTDGMKDSTYKAILDELGKIPADRDPAEAKALQQELTATQKRNHQLEDTIYDYEDQYGAVVRENQRFQNLYQQSSISLNIARYQIDRHSQDAQRARHRNVELHRRLEKFQKLIKLPKTAKHDRNLYSLTAIPTGVYFHSDREEKETLRSVYQLFRTYDGYYARAEWTRYYDHWKRIHFLQSQIDLLSKKLVCVSPYHLFLRDMKRGLVETNDPLPKSAREWGLRWRLASPYFRDEFIKRAQNTYRIVYPYNKKRTSKEYLYIKTGSNEYRSSLGVLAKICFDMDFLDRHGIDYCDDQVQLEECQHQLKTYLEEMKEKRPFRYTPQQPSDWGYL